MIKLESYSGSHDEKLTKALINLGKKPGETLDFGTTSWTFTRPQEIGSDYFCAHFLFSGLWAQVTYAGPGTWLTLKNWKHGTVRNLGLRTFDPSCSGVKFVCDGSSSQNLLENCKTEGFKVGIEWIGGGDGCLYKVSNCHTPRCGSGFKWTGSNILSPMILELCTSSQSKRGFDAREGGSGIRYVSCGGSDTEELFVLNGGYLGQIVSAETERCKTVLRIGGDDAGGFGQPSGYKFHATDLRDGASFVVNKAGKVCIDVDNVKNTPLTITTCNKSNLPLELSLPNVKGTVSNLEGKVFLDGTMVLPGKM